MKRKRIILIMLMCMCLLNSCSHERKTVSSEVSSFTPSVSESVGEASSDSHDETTSVTPSSAVSRPESKPGKTTTARPQEESSFVESVQSPSSELEPSVSSLPEISEAVSSESNIDTRYFARLLYGDYKSAFEKSSALSDSNVKIAEKYSCPEFGIDETSYLETRREEETKTASYRFFNRLNGRPTLTLIYCDGEGNAYVSEAGEKFITKAELVVIDMPRFFEISQDNVCDAQLSISGRRSNLTFSVENSEVCKDILSRISSDDHNIDGCVISDETVTFSANISPLGYLLSETMNVSFTVIKGDVKAYFTAEQCIEYTLPDMVLPPEDFGLVDKNS